MSRPPSPIHHAVQQTRRRVHRRGVVLPVAMWLLVVLLVVALGLAYDTQMSVKSVSNTQDRTEAYYAAYSGIERVCAELESGQVMYTAPAGTGDGTAGTWQYIDSDQEPLSPKAKFFRYMVITDDNCAKLDLNQADETALSKIPELTADQVQAILEYRGVTSGQSATTTTPGATSTADTETTTQTFKSVGDLLLLQNITPDLIYGVTTWQERLSPAERFRSDWAQLQQGQQAQAAQPQTPPANTNGATGALLTDRFVVDSAARRLGSDGQPRVTLASITREDLETRLQAVAENLGIDTSADTAGGNAGGNGGGNGRGQRTASPINAALNVLGNRGLRNWSDVWGRVSNNKEAVRLLADVITLPNDGGGGGDVNNGGTDSGGGGGGGFGGRPGGGGPGRGGGPGGGGPGGGGPGGGRPGGGGPGGGPGGGFPGGGGPGGGFPGGGGPGGGFPGGGGPGGGGRGASNRIGTLFPSLALFRPGRDRYQVQFVQGRGGGGGAGGGANPGGGNSGRPGGGGPGGGGRPGGGTSVGGSGSTTGTAATANSADAAAASEPMQGAINLNTATPEILATLPNMTDDVVQAIVAAREQAPFVSRGDILKIDQVTNAIFNGIVEKVTVISDSYTVRALGMSKNVSGGSGRINDLAVHLTATIDRTTGRCRIVRLRQDN